MTSSVGTSADAAMSTSTVQRLGACLISSSFVQMTCLSSQSRYTRAVRSTRRLRPRRRLSHAAAHGLGTAAQPPVRSGRGVRNLGPGRHPLSEAASSRLAPGVGQCHRAGWSTARPLRHSLGRAGGFASRRFRGRVVGMPQPLVRVAHASRYPRLTCSPTLTSWAGAWSTGSGGRLRSS